MKSPWKKIEMSLLSVPEVRAWGSHFGQDRVLTNLSTSVRAGKTLNAQPFGWSR